MTNMAVALAALFAASAPSGAQPFWEHFLGVSEWMARPDSHLLLFRLDANGDGLSEVFIAPEEKCGNGGCPWFVYSPLPQSRTFRYLGDAAFSVGGFRFERGVITLCWHISAAECMWGQYRFQGDDMTQLPGRICRTTAEGTSWCDAELDAIQEWQRHPPDLLFGTLAEYSGNTPTILWTTRSMTSVQVEKLPPFDQAMVERSP
jgi:hypothetical protein